MYQSTIVLKNHFSNKDLQYLRKLKEICKEDPKSNRSRMDTTKRNNKLFVCSNKTIISHRGLAEWINERLPFENKEEYEFQSINFYEIQVPFGMHSDTSKDQKYFYQGIIPLGIDPVDKDAYTLIFDQTAEENVEWIHPIFEKPEDYQPFFNKPVRDPHYFDNWKPGYKLPDEDCKKWFGKHWEYWQIAYEGFTVHTEYKWNVGDLFLFDSKHMHCATGLEQKGINSKEGLLFVLKKKN